MLNLSMLSAHHDLDHVGWCESRTPKLMLDFLKKQQVDSRSLFLQVPPGRRKARNFAVACCRRVSHLFRFPQLSDLLSVIEDYAEGRVGIEVVIGQCQQISNMVGEEVAVVSQLWDRVAREANRLAGQAKRMTSDINQLAHDYKLLQTTPADRLAHAACLWAASGNSVRAIDCWEGTAEAAANAGAELTSELSHQADLVREFFGNPFSTSVFNPSWRTTDVLDLASSAEATANFGIMPILADALQEAGCDDEEILHHCRDSAYHYRGCWVIDRILRS